MTSVNGLQRVIDYIADKEAANDDLNNNLTILGNQYQAHPETPTIEDEVEVEVLDSSLGSLMNGIKNSNMPQEENALQREEAHPTSSQFRLDRKINEIKSYFHNTHLFGGANQNNKQNPWPSEFLDDVYTRIWLTYRTGFPAIERAPDGPVSLNFGAIIRGTIDLSNKGLTTDSGWGCMIRTSQSLLANSLLALHVGRNWRYKQTDTENYEEKNQKHIDIVSWFIDIPPAPFSLHQFVEVGMQCSGKKPGEWFGPSAALKSIEILCDRFTDAGLKVYQATTNGEVYKDQLLELAGPDFNPILILSGIRLGVKNINELYWDSVKHNLSLPQSVGIAGGRPSSSHYFFGYQGDYLFYLDPHVPQKALLTTFSEEIDDMNKSNYVEISSHVDIESVHTKKIRKLHLSEMDPSMLVGILLKDKKDFEEWSLSIKEFESAYKIIDIFDTKATVIPVGFGTLTRSPGSSDSLSSDFCSSILAANEDEEFVDIGITSVPKDKEEKEHTSDTNEESFGNENQNHTNESKGNTFLVEKRRFSAPVLISKSDAFQSDTSVSDKMVSSEHYTTSVVEYGLDETFEKIEKPQSEADTESEHPPSTKGKILKGVL